MCRHLLCATIVAAMLTACHRTSPTRPSLPRPTVTVTSAQADTLAHRQKFIGILQSNYDAVIQPRINGFLASTNYDNSMPVRRGQVLFTIDPTPQSTQLLSARAQLQSAEAKAIEALNNYRRAQPLAKIDAISLSQLDQYTAQYKAAHAAVELARQAHRRATTEMGYTIISSPIDGIIAQSAVNVGDYIGPGTPFGVLTTISNIDTMSVQVAFPCRNISRHRNAKMTFTTTSISSPTSPCPSDV